MTRLRLSDTCDTTVCAQDADGAWQTTGRAMRALMRRVRVWVRTRDGWMDEADAAFTFEGLDAVALGEGIRVPADGEGGTLWRVVKITNSAAGGTTRVDCVAIPAGTAPEDGLS